MATSGLNYDCDAYDLNVDLLMHILPDENMHVIETDDNILFDLSASTSAIQANKD